MTPSEDLPDMLSSTGSSQSGEPAFLVIGKLRAPHGLQGEMLMEVITDFPERIKPGIELFVGEDHHPYRLLSVRNHTKGLLIGFEGFKTPEEAGILRNRFVYVATSRLPVLPEGEYYHHQLLGMEVIAEDGRSLGRLAEILETSANDIYVVHPDSGPDLLLPAIESVILNIDLPAGQMTVHLLPGL